MNYYTVKWPAKLSQQLPLRVYAPVGNHSDLLPYLVRRLLENGANSSFVNQFLDSNVPADSIVHNVEDEVNALPGYRHSHIPLPKDIYRVASDPRDNSRGVDLDDPVAMTTVDQGIQDARKLKWLAGPIIDGIMLNGESKAFAFPR